MTLADVMGVVQVLFLAYFVLLNGGYVMLNLISMITLTRYMSEHSLTALPQAGTGLEPPISLLVPAFNEEATIAASVRSLLQLSYPEFEVIVVNDDSKDRTLDVLIREFSLRPFPEAYRVRLKTQAIRAVYQSTDHPNLRVLDKANGGKADALNAGANVARYPLLCCVDADSILQRDSLRRVVQPFLEDPRTVATGGTIRIANGCEVSGGFLVRAGLPRNLLALFQVIEYLRAFLFGRMGWSPLNALLIISGAFGLFHKETLISVGGYRPKTIGEDMELIVRLHRVLRQQGRKYRIVFVPDPVCWTQAPEDLRTLRNQRIRWQRGLSDSLMMNRALLFHPKGGAVGWLAFPFILVFEWFSPIVLVAGYAFTLTAVLTGLLSPPALLAFLAVEIGLGVLLSVSALLLEELSFRIYPKLSHVGLLFLASLLENFGYRQINSWWRLVGLYRWATGAQARWGEMKRKGL